MRKEGHKKIWPIFKCLVNTLFVNQKDDNQR